jgi:hypothetical protein
MRPKGNTARKHNLSNWLSREVLRLDDVEGGLII